MTRRKQPSKRAREMAARYCDSMAAWWMSLGARPDWTDFPIAKSSSRLAWSVAEHPKMDLLAMASFFDVWAEAAAWLRSGEDLP